MTIFLLYLLILVIITSRLFKQLLKLASMHGFVRSETTVGTPGSQHLDTSLCRLTILGNGAQVTAPLDASCELAW